jgi:hypothetical protein
MMSQVIAPPSGGAEVGPSSPSAPPSPWRNRVADAHERAAHLHRELAGIALRFGDFTRATGYLLTCSGHERKALEIRQSD